MTEPTNLHALLGDRYDAVIEKAARTLFALEEPDRNDWRWNRTNPDDPLGPVAWHSYWLGAAESALGAVLPGLLAEAWDEGYEAAAGDFHDDEFGLPGDRTPNPYRTEETR